MYCKTRGAAVANVQECRHEELHAAITVWFAAHQFPSRENGILGAIAGHRRDDDDSEGAADQMVEVISPVVQPFAFDSCEQSSVADGECDSGLHPRLSEFLSVQHRDTAITCTHRIVIVRGEEMTTELNLSLLTDDGVGVATGSD